MKEPSYDRVASALLMVGAFCVVQGATIMAFSKNDSTPALVAAALMICGLAIILSPVAYGLIHSMIFGEPVRREDSSWIRELSGGGNQISCVHDASAGHFPKLG